MLFNRGFSSLTISLALKAANRHLSLTKERPVHVLNFQAEVESLVLHTSLSAIGHAAEEFIRVESSPKAPSLVALDISLMEVSKSFSLSA